MWVLLFAGILLATSNSAQARQNGDPLLVGETVRLRVFVENDYYLQVAACGRVQCGGVRVEGVAPEGMGFATFLSRTSSAFTPRWMFKPSLPYGTTFTGGREYEFVVHRPEKGRLQLWLRGREGRVANVKVDVGELLLYVRFRKGGEFWFVDDHVAENGVPKSRTEIRRELCARSRSGAIKPVEVVEKGAETIRVSTTCRYISPDKINAMCIVYLGVDGEKGRREIYRSRMARDDYDSQLTEAIDLSFKFEEQQILIFEAYDNYSDCDTPPESELRGTLQTNLAAINSKGKAELRLAENFEEFSVRFSLNCDERITLQLSGRHIDAEAAGDIFLKIKKAPGGGGDKHSAFQLVAETRKVARDGNLFHWGNMTLSMQDLCDGDYDRPLKIYALEENKDYGDILIGYFETTAKELKHPKNTFLLINKIKMAQQLGNTPYNNSGEIYIGEIPLSPTFSQYVSKGFGLVGTVQIDFTGSNDGPPSLHQLGDTDNQYEVAIHSVGEIVENYISDAVFKAYGFGAEVPSRGVLHDFNLNLSSTDPDCVGVKGVLSTYRESLPKLTTSGPTHYAPGLRNVVDMARQYQDGSKYFIHLLLTDGLLHDAEETKKAILDASNLPISIIILGIGNSDFKLLHSLALHSDTTPTDGATPTTQSSLVVWDQGERVARDIVQVVEMKAFTHNDTDSLKRELRKTVLQKIPPQYLEYMKIKKIPPTPPKNSTITRVCS